MSTLIAILVCAALFAVLAVARVRHQECGGACAGCTLDCPSKGEDHAHR